MLIVRALALVGVLAIAGFVNMFLAPQIYSPRAPVFTGADMAASPQWSGHAFSFQPSWLAENLPESTFTHVRVDRPPWFEGEGTEVGLLWNERTVIIEGLRTNDSRFPLDVSDLGVRDALANHHQLVAEIRCQNEPQRTGPVLCDYFVAWDDTVSPDDALTFVAVFTHTERDEQEVGFVEQGLLTRLLGVSVANVPTIGDEPQ
jgi:hypothetical protein